MKILNNIKEAALELWNDDQGAEGLEKVLILAAVALPLLAVLLYFASEIRTWVANSWNSVVGTSSESNSTSDNPFSDGGGF